MTDHTMSLVPVDKIESSIMSFRNQKIMLDHDLAVLYGVETKVLVRAVKRNLDRFPTDFMFQLSDEEFEKHPGARNRRLKVCGAGGWVRPLRLHRAGGGHAFQRAPGHQRRSHLPDGTGRDDSSANTSPKC